MMMYSRFLKCVSRPVANGLTVQCKTVSFRPNVLLQQMANVRMMSSGAGAGSKSSGGKIMEDEEVDTWLAAIEELKEEFSKTGFKPETSLAPPGQAKLDIPEEVISSSKQFIPSERQLDESESLKGFELPQRKDPILEHVTNMIMRHGKKPAAERTLSRALYIVFLQLRKDPIEILKKALDDLGPLMIVKTFNTGVAKKAVIPVPLNQRQRTRLAWKWIIEGANKRSSSELSVRLAEELISVHRGSSSSFNKRDQLHKTAIAHRSYIKLN
ncbi:hypothetical protein Kpol_1013p71 [Vanderwaltozyma polyspora DSM 70294]|uniref:Small ribosomal subunit protein uS7m n=1 Tax=Vanderwaltozyma polyspora (strain ATCC 22028 / DSM 70294 / BCRC 21397 / CBS 2163 / NBRC 10782 / NRRL Y-8283 / UCD 57-17) TaxID=436907 RepID=A7THB5_VANPO|nr:uncharacterized protein Kpol_1013p71 [Vanderwaltozyma polyspora DSM 70294]EDO18396.1 hypothetical protein Kpol_1013p71 [Vanderwaltozyma polyspora DSM 70294]